MSGDMEKRMEEIRAIGDKYGFVLFKMALSHLFDIGHRNLTDACVEESVKKIMDKADSEKARSEVSIMTPEFQCEIIRCSAELARFGIWTLFVYIKKYLFIGGL